MRLIGYTSDKASAVKFTDFLLVEGITSSVEEESDGRQAIWVREEEFLDQARDFLREFTSNPSDAKFVQAGRAAEKVRSADRQEEKKGRTFTSEEVFNRSRVFSIGPLTLGLIIISVLLYLLRESEATAALIHNLYISEMGAPGSRHALSGLSEVRRGELWRLVTPILLHGGLLHLFFNMYWLKDLGSPIENAKGTGYFALMVVGIAVLSNLGQYIWNGPFFVGMSGVNYGLFAYIWMKSKFDPFSGFFMAPSTVTVMLVWFVLCWFPFFMPNVANGTHTVGLLVGIVWGYLDATRSRY